MFEYKYPASESVHEGTIAGRYEVRGLLGQGGFGIVYLVQDRDGGAVYAFKTLRAEHASELAVDRFRQEAKIWLGLGHHPYIVGAHFVVRDGARLYLALDYVSPGEQGRPTLSSFLTGVPQPLDQVLRWAIQVCHGMEHAYALGLHSHRDLKPANILIGAHRRVKITDFGLAQPLPAAGQFAELHLATLGHSLELPPPVQPPPVAGTPTHMAPEQFVTVEACDERTDLYSFGVVLFQLATGGQLPFRVAPPAASSQEEYRRFVAEMQRMHGEAEPLRLDSPLQPLVARCMRKDPAERYPSFAALRADVEALLFELTGRAEVPPPLDEPATTALIQRGRSLYHLGSLDGALQLFDQALGLDAREAQAWNGKGLVLYGQKRYAAALGCFEEALRSAPDDLDALVRRALCQYRLGRYEEASAGFEAVLERDWGALAAWNGLANCHFAVGLYDEALAVYETALAFDDGQPGLWLNRALALQKLRRFDEAHADVDRALALAPSYAPASLAKGHLFVDGGAPGDALPHLKAALALKPESWKVMQSLGNAHLMMREADEALSCFNHALELAPWHAGLWSSAGVALFELGRYDESARHLRQAVQLEPESELAWYDWGTYYLLRRQCEKALAAYDRALVARPEVAFTWFHSGVAYAAEARHEQAVVCFDRALRLGFDDPALHFDAGCCLHRVGDYEAAHRHFGEVVRRDPRDAEAWEGRALCCDRLGLANDGRECRDRARLLRTRGEATAPRRLHEGATVRLSRYRPFRLHKVRRPLDFTAFPESAARDRASVPGGDDTPAAGSSGSAFRAVPPQDLPRLDT